MQTVLVLAAAAAGGVVTGTAAPAAWRVPPRLPPDVAPNPLPGPPAGGVIAFAVAGAAGGGLVAAQVGWHLALPGLLAAALAGIWLAAVDLRVHRLPATVVYAATAAVVALLAVAAGLEGDGRRLVATLAGAAGLWLVYRVVAVAVGGVGAGDVRLAGLVGAVGGWAGWSGWVLAVMLPFAVFAAVGALAWAAGWRVRGQPLPFGPAMVFGLLAAVGIGG